MDSWNKIPPKHQELMNKLARQAVDKNVEIANQLAAPALAKFKEQGIQVNRQSKAERDKMVEVAKKTWDDWVKAQEKAGRKDARMVMDMILKKAKEYEPKDPYK
jgi:TRAP-type C4-dicarboxylate transport system substrate-binding protein